MAKLNFWQWLGLVLLIVGVVMLILRETGEEEARPIQTPTTLPAPEPDTAPATNPG